MRAFPRDRAVRAFPRDRAVRAFPRDRAVRAFPRDRAVPAFQRDRAVPAFPRNRAVRALGLTGIVFAVLALGPQLKWQGIRTGIPLPYAALAPLPSPAAAH